MATMADTSVKLQVDDILLRLIFQRKLDICNLVSDSIRIGIDSN